MQTSIKTLQKLRAQYQPKLPRILTDLQQVNLFREKSAQPIQEEVEVAALFPQTFGGLILKGKKGTQRLLKEHRIGVVFSGGQAPGGHNVITGLFDALQILNPKNRLFGFLDGPAGIVDGKIIELNLDLIQKFRNQGGFELIGSGRIKIETEKQLTASIAVMRKHALDGLVIIGGDDSNTNAAILAEYFLAHGCSTAVVGVPKTIDGDLKNAYVATPFGFDTACKIYSEQIGNIARDALSAKKYTHFIKLMGRSASHVALECALAVQPNLTLIGEEVAASKMTLQQVTHMIADLICKRSERGKNYSIILIPEGLIEFIPEIAALISELNILLAAIEKPHIEELLGKLSDSSRGCFLSLPETIQKQLLFNRDSHGNVQVSLIETERLLTATVSQELEQRRQAGGYKGKFNPQQHFFGYEGRAGFPSNFDCNYCYALGFTAALLVDEGVTGYMCYVQGLNHPVDEWEIGGLPITMLMNREIRKGVLKPVIRKALVDLKGRAYTYLQQEKEKWAFEDAYCFPGPIQFYGDPAITDSIPLSIY